MRSTANRTAALGGFLAAIAVGVECIGYNLRASERLGANGVNALALTVAGAALALSVILRSNAAPRLRPPRAIASFLAGILAGLSLLAYVDVGNVQFPYHRWEHFHYYMGAKYFRELSYSRIYTCTAVAEAERFGQARVAGRGLRDLVADEVVPAATALEHPEDCKRYFSPARWTAFGDDVAWFRHDTPAYYWAQMQQDHGFNPPPTWAIAGGALASLAPASARTQTALAAGDPLLLAAAFGLIGWAFGAHVMWVALVVWACQFPSRAAWTAGAFLRQDWFLSVVAAVCFARRGWGLLAGLALASAAALRIFPVFLLGLPMLIIARRAWSGTAIRLDRRFVVGLLAGGAVWFGASTALFGFDAWRAFARHMAVHRNAPLANHIGVRAILAQTDAGRLAKIQDARVLDTFRAWRAARREAFAARKPIYQMIVTAVVVLAVAASRRIDRLWCALAASSVLVFAGVDVASYYCAFLIVLALLAASSRIQEWLALGAVVVGRAVNAFPALAANPDVRYTLQSVVLVAWSVLALATLAWWGRSLPSSRDDFGEFEPLPSAVGRSASSSAQQRDAS